MKSQIHVFKYKSCSNRREWRIAVENACVARIHDHICELLLFNFIKCVFFYLGSALYAQGEWICGCWHGRPNKCHMDMEDAGGLLTDNDYLCSRKIVKYRLFKLEVPPTPSSIEGVGGGLEAYFCARCRTRSEIDKVVILQGPILQDPKCRARPGIDKVVILQDPTC